VGIRLSLLLCLALAAANLAAQDAPKPQPKPTIAELWDTGCLWEVGDNRVTVPKARQALVDAGQQALDYALTRLDAANTLETRCLAVVFAGWKAKPELAPKALEGLIANIGRAEPTGRRNVADLLDQFDDRKAIEPLLARAKVEEVESVRMAQLAPLARWKAVDALPLLLQASRSKLERLRARAPGLLLNFEDEPTAFARLMELVGDPTYYVADAAQETLKKTSPANRARCVALLQDQLKPEADPKLLQSARRLLAVVATLADAKTPGTLMGALGHADAGVRGDAATALAAWKTGAGLLDNETDVQGKLASALDSETDPFCKASLTRALQQLSESRKNG